MDDQPRTASLKALAGRKRTTVFALILIASPVCGLRPMRALRCAFTARPRFGITNLPAPPLHSLTASLKSSSKNEFTVFLGVSNFSARWPTILDLLIGFAISILPLLRRSFGIRAFVEARIRAAHARHYKESPAATQEKMQKTRRKSTVSRDYEVS